MSNALHDYLLQSSLREDEVLRALRQETASLTMSRMQISPEQGQWMTLMTQLIGAKRILEVGTFTGYSTLCMARGLPDDGEIVACDVSEEWTNMARKYWEKAQVDGKINLTLAPALETLDALISKGQAGTFDLAFIDADKGNYKHYYERALTLLRPNGLILVDNVLWGGHVINPETNDEDTVAIRELNAHIKQDERVSVSIMPIGDGVTMARKR